MIGAKWSYHIEKFTLECGTPAVGIGIAKPTNVYDTVSKRLNDLGMQGWELVQVAPPLPDSSAQTPAIMIYYFKKQIN